MNRIIKKVGILFAVFTAALLIYIAGNRERLLQEDTVYAAMEDSRLPVVYVEMYGRKLNPTYGYRQDMGNAVARDSLTVLPEDRALAVYVAGGREAVLAMRYEIRSLDQQRLVENTSLESWKQTADGIRGILPIQNLLARDREYLLRLELDMEQMGTVYYYTRIIWTESDYVRSMVELAADFSAKTFDYEQARSLVTYLETDAQEDNSSYGHTTIRSSFANLTWGHLDMERASEPQITLKELEGVMGCVSLEYMAFRQREDGIREWYDVEENFTMKWNEIRTYMMDYERFADRIFTADEDDYTGRRIMLGITNDDRIGMEKSPDGKIVAYRANRELWSYDRSQNRAVQVFSFRGSQPEAADNICLEHDVQILQVTDEGDVDFLVYGYQNRGSHEGQSGIAGYRYDSSENGLHERFFIPVAMSFEQLNHDLQQLSCRTSGDMLYLYLDHGIYGIDLTSNENMVVADALEEGGFAVSADQSRIAWQEEGDVHGSAVVHLMDLESGAKLDIRGEDGEVVRPLGFVGQDLVYGIAREDNLWVSNGRVKGLPMDAIEIMNQQMQVETRYEKEGYYIAGVDVEESRIHINRVTRMASQQYAQAQDDTIVCNAEMGPGQLDGIGWYASQNMGKLYFVQLDGEIRSNRGIHVLSPRRISYEQSGVLQLKSNARFQSMQFFAYGGGHLLGITADFSQAVALAYERMGIVVDQQQRILWGRVNRRSSCSIKNPATVFMPVERQLEEFYENGMISEKLLMLDARGCTMMQMLYFVDQGIPVLGYADQGRHLLLCGFDQYNATLYDRVSGETYKAGLNDSTEFFSRYGNDFVCAVELP